MLMTEVTLELTLGLGFFAVLEQREQSHLFGGAFPETPQPCFLWQLGVCRDSVQNLTGMRKELETNTWDGCCSGF